MNAQILRNLIMRYGAQAGIPKDVRELIWHVTDHDFHSRGFSYPGQQRLAERMGYLNVESIRRIAKKAHAEGWLIVFPGQGQGRATRYHIGEKLVVAMQGFLKKEAEKAIDNFHAEPPTLFGVNPYDDPPKPLRKSNETHTPVGGNTGLKTDPKTVTKEKKAFYSEYVQMKPTEYNKLLEVYGYKQTANMIFTLDLAIPNQTRKPYKDHYRAILKWVVENIKAIPMKGKSANPLLEEEVKKLAPAPVEEERTDPKVVSKAIAEAKDNMVQAKQLRKLADNKNRTNTPKSIGEILIKRN